MGFNNTGINTNTVGVRYISSNIGRKGGALWSRDEQKYMKIQEVVILELIQALKSSNKP